MILQASELQDPQKMQNDAESMAQVLYANEWQHIMETVCATSRGAGLMSRLASSNCRSCKSRKDNMQQKISLSSVMGK